MNVTFAIECSEGHQYLLKLTECKNLPIEIDIKIVDIALVPVSKPDTINNAGTLNKIASILFNFLEENDVILYFYCSKDPIQQRESREPMSYQKYRSFLFTCMYNKTSKDHNDEFIHKQIVLLDQVYGDHYVHLITKSKYTQKINDLETSLNEFNK